MNIEGNFDIIKWSDGSRPAIVDITIGIPHDAWYMLEERLRSKRITQVYVKLGMPRKPRTTGDKSQSHHFNGHVQQIAAYTGNSFDDEKMHLKREAISMGYPSHTTTYGDVVPESEANASTVECGYLIDTAHEVASFLNLKLKETDDA